MVRAGLRQMPAQTRGRYFITQRVLLTGGGANSRCPRGFGRSCGRVARPARSVGADQFNDSLDQAIGIDRLCDVRIESCGQRTLAILLARESRHRDRRNSLEMMFAFHAPNILSTDEHSAGRTSSRKLRVMRPGGRLMKGATSP